MPLTMLLFLPTRWPVLVCILVSTQADSLKHHLTYNDIQDYKNHTCKRPCQDGQPPMVCDYDFLIEHYHTMTKACWDCPFNVSSCSRPHCVPADGGLRGIITVNRMMPGPSIQVCENDVIRVRVHNKMENSEGTSIHWHGLLQRGTPYMDGVSMVTQCPIPAHSSFTYVFNASTPGTHFWHAHSGLQRADGLYGHLVIRQAPSKEVHHDLYDFDLPEHVIVVNDWWHRDSPSSFAQHHHSNGDNKPSSVLINGKGAFTTYYHRLTDRNVTTPREMFNVTLGKRYRFRVASNGILNCPLLVSVDNHSLEIIASDGQPLEPLTVDAFNIFAGERYDFILTANQTSGDYLMRFRGMLDCAPRFKDAQQTAILHYEDVEMTEDFSSTPSHFTKILNPINSAGSQTEIPVVELRSMQDDDIALTKTPDRTIVVAMDFKAIDNPRFHNPVLYSTRDFLLGNRQLQTTQMNDISNMMPPAPPLSQYQDLPQDLLCNAEIMKTQQRDCGNEYCECIHFYKLRLGDVIEVILVDQGHIWDANHPTHLHGHGFRIVAMGKLGSSIYAKNVTDLDLSGNITRNIHKAPIKDTVTVPDGGYTIIRFHANNPEDVPIISEFNICCHKFLLAEFNAAKNRLTEEQKKLLLENPWYMGHSYFIESLPDSFRYKMLGQRIMVILKIISNMQSDEEGFRLVNVSDVTNKVTILRFRLQDSDEVDSLKYKLRVGTFVAIVQARLSVYSYTDKASEIVIDNLKQVEFIRGT